MKKVFCIILLCWAAVAVFGQARPTLAILPFTGASGGDGETLAELFSFDSTLNGAFTPVPRTSINNAIRQEQNFQMGSGMTDPETIARLGRQLGARYIVAGSITRLGSQQLLVIAILQIENLQQIAGEWRTYTDITEIRNQLPGMAANIVAASRKDTSKLQKLAVLPFQMTAGDREADVLAQILAAELLRSGTYAVFPRTKTLEQVQAEYRTQLGGDTADEYAISVGRGDNPLLALSGAARSLGSDMKMFNAAIINVENGTQEKGDSVDYKVIEDGITAMRELAGKLTAATATATDGADNRVSNAGEFLDAVAAINRGGAGSYTITLTGDISLRSNNRIFGFADNAQKTVTIRGERRERVIRNGHDNNAMVHVQSGITLVLGENVRLCSTERGVEVRSGGTLRMEIGATIADCGNGGVDNRGTFIMNGGTISGNAGTGGGVLINRGTFIMNGGTISGNTAPSGGYGGGGVFINNGGTFTMKGGTISDNTDNSWSDGGGGVSVSDGTFTMTGGTISGNTATRDGGGGVWIGRNGTFIKTGGTVAANNKAGTRGTNVVGGERKRNRAAGPSVNLDSRTAGRAGGWE